MTAPSEFSQGPQDRSDPTFHNYEADLAEASELHRDPGADVRHFRARLQDKLSNLRTPTVQRDAHGNRLFESSDLAYHDRRNRPTKASLLLSGEGQDWLQRNPGILGDINRGLLALTHPAPDIDPPATIDLGNDRQLSRMAFPSVNQGHRQSVVYILQTGADKYVIKTANHGNSLAQPYINEMLQTQELAHDMQKEFLAAGVELPRYLFATGQVSCTEFVEGTTPNPDQAHRATGELHAQVNRYIRRQPRSLWRGIASDMANRYNYIRRPNGSLVCIDPFYPPQ